MSDEKKPSLKELVERRINEPTPEMDQFAKELSRLMKESPTTVTPAQRMVLERFKQFWESGLVSEQKSSGTHVGRVSFAGPVPTPPRCSHAIDEVVPGCVECGRDDVKDVLIAADFADLELRVMAFDTETVREFTPNETSTRGITTGRMSSSGNGLSNLPKCDHGMSADCPQCLGYQPCAPGCKGWLHMDDPYEIEACDECQRFKGDDREEQAQAAHKKECGCDWPNFDYRHASMAWMYDIDNFTQVSDAIQQSNASVMRNFIETEGQEFIDNVIPAIYLCTQMIDREKGELAKKAIAGLRKLMMEVKEKLHTKELSLKDFQSHDYEAPGRCKEDFSSPTTGY